MRPDVDEVVLSLSFIAGANGLQDLGAVAQNRWYGPLV